MEAYPRRELEYRVCDRDQWHKKLIGGKTGSDGTEDKKAKD